MAKDKDVKESKSIICENCDSEFKVSYMKSIVSGELQYCCFCGEDLEVIDEDENEFEEDIEEEDY